MCSNFSVFHLMSFKVILFTCVVACGLATLSTIHSCSPTDTVDSEEAVHLLTAKAPQWNYGDQAYAHAKEIVAFGPRPAESQELEKSRQYIQKALSERGWLVKRQAFMAITPEGKKQFVNLFARYQGESEAPQQVWARKHKAVVGAHIDTKKIAGINYLGAVDAAGSVGMVIELAEFYAKHSVEQAKQLELVFFDGEEAIQEFINYGDGGQQDGLYGSHHYALNRNLVRKFGVVLDLLGSENQVIKVPSDTPKKLYRSMLKVAAAHGVAAQFKMADNQIIDDHVPLNMFGTPTIDLIGGDFTTSNWWHQKGDTMDALSAKQLGVSLKVAIDLVAIELAK